MPHQRLIQITDLHFCEEPGDILCSGVITDHSLQRVLAEVLDREGEGATVLVTGDLVQDPVPAAYERLRDTLSSYPFHFHCLPGNHDDADLMRRILPGPNLSTGREVPLGDWTMLLLDSQVPGIPHGRLGSAEMNRFRNALAGVGAEHVLVALHHQPVSLRSPWMDRMALADSAEFFATLAADGRVRAVVFGHVHQEVDTVRDGARLLGTPSTCVQFLPRTLTMSLDALAPAYRWLDLGDDGRVDTDVVYLEEEKLLVTA